MLIRLIIAVVVAVVISGFYQGYVSQSGIYKIDLVTMLSFVAATVISALLGSFRKDAACAYDEVPVAEHKQQIGDREEGSVKWFNVSKGFGFITRSNGEDIFVHYRSIRGQGRRRLFDGQQVSFVIIDSDKGLQADDVDIIK